MANPQIKEQDESINKKLYQNEARVRNLDYPCDLNVEVSFSKTVGNNHTDLIKEKKHIT